MGRNRGGGSKGSFWDNPFGGLFDFNHDGKEDFSEQWLAWRIFQESTKKKPADDDFFSPVSVSFPAQDDFDDDEDKYDWRNACEDGFDVGIFPEDYETEAEYEEALENARFAQSASVTIPISLSFELTYPGKEALDAIKESDYPNKRKYDAAYHLCDVKQGTAYIPTDSSPEEEIARCEFILNSDTIAAKYLTVYGGFLYAQAVKENFSLPIAVPDEDKEVVTNFGDLLLELAEEDTPLAVKVWSWSVQEFGPYSQYMKNKWELYNRILAFSGDYPPEFVDLTLEEMAVNPDFLTGVLEKNPEFPSVAKHIAYALEHEQPDIASRMFRSAIANPAGKEKGLEDFIERILSGCANRNELETMEAFKFHILPIIAQIEDKRIQRLLPRFQERIDSYIHSVESRCEQYQYSRRFAWRKTCEDGSAYGLDPLDYETEEEYHEAILQRKYGWREWRSQQAKQYGLNVEDYETDNAFMAALTEVQRKADVRRFKRTETDPLADTDMTVYTFCGVVFSSSSQIYHYRTDDDSLRVGDVVVVPVGRDGKEEVAEIVTVEKHRRRTAPYPVDKAKFIKRRYADK